MTVEILVGDARDRLKEMPDASVHCCITSPPYFGLRDYQVDGQMGLEDTPAEFVAGMVALFREVRRVLRDDATLWLNLGDSYAGSRSGRQGRLDEMANRSLAPQRVMRDQDGNHVARSGGAPKSLLGIPWRVALALQDDGWILRQDIIWSKPNPMPESVRDRCTKAHEYIFLLSKSPRYYFDQAAILEPASPNTHARLAQNGLADQKGSDRVPGKTNGPMKAVGRKFDPAAGNKNNRSFDAAMAVMPIERNRRSVWTVATQPFSGAHFATFPPALIEPCVLAGCPVGGTVLDPFGGAGTTGLVSDRLGRNAVLIELNPEYADLARDRLRGELCQVQSEAIEREHDAGPLFGSAAT